MSGDPLSPQHPRPPQGWADTLILTTVAGGLAFCVLTLLGVIP